MLVKFPISVTPSRQKLKISSNIASVFVEESKLVSYKCEAARVKPLPRVMYFKFTDSDTPLATTSSAETNRDGLTSKVSTEYTFTVHRNHDGKKLQCVFVTWSYQVITSEEQRMIRVLCKYNEPI